MTTLTGQALQQIGTEMFGEKTWRKQLAEVLGLSYARVSQLSNAAQVPAKSAAKIVSLHEQWKVSGMVTPGIIQTGIIVKDDEAGFTDAQIVERINKLSLIHI